MEALEFKTRIRNGMIQIPDKFKDIFGASVRVIIIKEKKTDKTADIIGELLADPIKVEGFSPLSRDDIYERI